MWYELFLGLHAQGFVARVSALIPAAWAEESTILGLLKSKIHLGTQFQDCEVTLTEPWSGAEINNPGKGMYQASATCDGYVVMWHPPVPSTQTTVVLQAHPIIEDLFSVSGAHTMQGIG